MADTPKPKSGGGCIGTLATLVLLASASALAAAVFFIIQPQDLSDIGGYGPSAKSATPRDVKAVMRSAIDRGQAVVFTEAEINQWLGRTLGAKQGGMLAGQVSLDRVWVRLENGFAEVITGRSVMGRPFTVSMFLKVEQKQGPSEVRTEVSLHGGPYHELLPKPPRGGRFGRLVVPQGFLILILPSYRKLAETYREEIHLAFEEMTRVRIEPNRLILESQEFADRSAVLPKTF
jgi:hypothetical protein